MGDLNNAWIARLAVGHLEGEMRYNAILQGLLAQGMPYETAILKVNTIREQEAATARRSPGSVFFSLLLILAGIFFVSSVRFGGFDAGTIINGLFGAALLVWGYLRLR